MSIPPRLAFLLITLVFAIQLLAHVVRFVPSSYNYRLEYGHTFKSGMGIARKWSGLPHLSKYPVEEDDDKGASFVAAMAIMGSHSKDDIDADRPTTIPNSFFYFFDLVYFCTILLIWWSSSSWVNPAFGNLIAFLLLASSSFSFVFFSAEIYIFPLFSIALLLSWAALLQKKLFLATCLAPLFAGLLFLSDIFRNSSVLFGVFFTLLIFAPNYLQLGAKARRAGMIFLITLIALKFVFSPAKAHPIWQSIHAGFSNSAAGWIQRIIRLIQNGCARQSSHPIVSIFPIGVMAFRPSCYAKPIQTLHCTVNTKPSMENSLKEKC